MEEDRRITSDIIDQLIESDEVVDEEYFQIQLRSANEVSVASSEYWGFELGSD
jgi:hypothetical protein